MTLYEFNILDKNEKHQTTCDLGIQIDFIIDEDLRINLYAIDKFLVEIHYNARSNKILDVKFFIHGLVFSKSKYPNIMFEF